jgi:hypothetical protein
LSSLSTVQILRSKGMGSDHSIFDIIVRCILPQPALPFLQVVNNDENINILISLDKIPLLTHLYKIRASTHVLPLDCDVFDSLEDDFGDADCFLWAHGLLRICSMIWITALFLLIHGKECGQSPDCKSTQLSV